MPQPPSGEDRHPSNVLRYIVASNFAKQSHLFALVILAVLLGLAPIHLTRMIVDQVIPRRDTSLLATAGIVFLLVVIVRSWVDYRQTMVGEEIRQLVISRLRSEMFHHILRVAPDFYTRQSVGQIMNRVQTDVGRLGMSVAWIFVQPVVETTTFIIYAAYLLSLNWFLALLAATTLPAVALIAPAINRRLSATSKSFTHQMGSYGANLQESLSGSFEIQVHGTFGYEQNRLNSRHQGVVDTWLAITRYNAWLTILSDLARGVGPILVYCYGALLAIRGQMQIGEIVAFAGVLGGLYLSVDKLIKYPPLLKNAQDRFEELCEYFDIPQVFQDGTAAAGREAEPGDKPGARVALRRVGFGYDRRQQTIADLSMELEPGEHVALVGRSGCGKSTVLSLVGGRLRAREGDVRIDGEGMEKLTSSWRAENIGSVGQTPFLFSTTVRNNLLYALFRLPVGEPDDPMTYLDPRPWGRVTAPESRDLDALLIAACRDVGFDEDLFDLGLQARVPASRAGGLLDVCRRFAAVAAGDPALDRLEPGAYLASGTVAENLIFAPLGEARPNDETLAAWIAAARRTDTGLADLLAQIGWENVSRDLDYLKRVALESPQLLADFGVSRQDLDERVRLAERVRGGDIAESAIGRGLYRDLVRQGVLARESDPARRRRIVVRAWPSIALALLRLQTTRFLELKRKYLATVKGGGG